MLHFELERADQIKGLSDQIKRLPITMHMIPEKVIVGVQQLHAITALANKMCMDEDISKTELLALQNFLTCLQKMLTTPTPELAKECIEKAEAILETYSWGKILWASTLIILGSLAMISPLSLVAVAVPVAIGLGATGFGLFMSGVAFFSTNTMNKNSGVIDLMSSLKKNPISESDTTEIESLTNPVCS